MLKTKQRVGEKAEQTLNTQTARYFLKDLLLTYHLLIMTSQQSGMTCGKSFRHVSLPPPDHPSDSPCYFR